jgi:hypothetical protein
LTGWPIASWRWRKIKPSHIYDAIELAQVDESILGYEFSDEAIDGAAG